MLSVNRVVIKIGGKSLSDSAQEIIDLVFSLHKEKELVIVVSALEGVTNDLIHLSESGRTDVPEAIVEKYEGLASALGIDVVFVKDHFSCLEKDLKRKEDFPVKRAFVDHVTSFGEIISAKIFAEALRIQGIEGEFIDASRIIRTDSQFGSATVDLHKTKKNVEIITNSSLKGKIPVLPGFLGGYCELRTVLGRGGSDYTASIIASLINAQCVVKISDVEGIYTTDPTIVKKARVLPFVSYEEAMVSSKTGMKVLHEKAIEPVKSKVPIILGKIKEGELEVGTLISSISAKYPIMSHKSLDNEHTLVGVTGTQSMLSTPLNVPGRDSGIQVKKEELTETLSTLHSQIVERVKVSVPATIANVGPGFDVFGLCLKEPMDVIEMGWNEEMMVKVEGYSVPHDPRENAASGAALFLLDLLGIEKSFKMKVKKGIEPSKGLGSSGASALGGALATANLLGITNKKLVIKAAVEGERIASGTAHGDNVVPALFGGFTILRSVDPLDVVKIPSPLLKILIVTPSVSIDTMEARKLLPAHVPLKDVVKNLALASSLVDALRNNDLQRIGQSLEDYLAIPYRKPLIPWFEKVRAAAIASGAYGISLSGSGSTLFAVGREEDLEDMGHAITETLKEEGIGSRFFIGQIGNGATIGGETQ